MSPIVHQAWRILVRYPILIGIALILAQTLPVLDSRWLWFSDEVRYAEVYSNLIEQGHWIVLNLNGAAYPDKPPVYFLFLALLDMIPGVQMPGVLWLGSAISAITLLFAMQALAKAVRLEPEGFAAGMVVQLGLFAMVMLLHYVRMDLLFVAFMIAGQACLHRYYFNGEPAKYAYAGFALAGFSVLIKGPLGLVLPLAAVWGTALWSGRGAAIWRKTTAVGLAVSALVISSWGAGIIAVQGWPFLRDQIIGKQVIERATDTFHHSEPLSYYFVLLPLVLLPWTGLAIALPWRRVWHWPAMIWHQRADLGPVGILALGAVLHFAVLSALDGKVGVYLLPVLVQFALMVGAIMMAKPMVRGWLGVAAMIALVGGALIVLSRTAEAAPYASQALIAGVYLIALAGIVAVFRWAAKAALLILAPAMVIFSLILAQMVLPGLNDSTSTRIPAEYLGRFAQQGDVPVAYRTYPGIFSFYAGRDVVQIESEAEMATLIQNSPQIVIAGLARQLEKLDLTGFETLDSRIINGAGGRYMVVRKGPSP